MRQFTSAEFISPENMRDFSSLYKKLTETGEPIHRMDDFFGMGAAWIVHSHDDVARILKDPRFVINMKHLASNTPNSESSTIQSLVEKLQSMPNMITVDPPDHTRLRRLASKAFTPRMVEELQPRIQQIADELLDAVQARGQMNIVEDYAYPLPIKVISEMLGVPASDHTRFREWTKTISNSSLDPSKLNEVESALEAFMEYIKTLVEEKRKKPSNDVISSLIQAYEDGDQFTENEIISTIWLLITAGHETTVHLITNGTLALLQHPEQMNQLLNDSSLLPSAVEEMLRYAGPVMFGMRIAGEDLVLHGQEVRKGEVVVLSIAAAHLEASKFENAAEFNITREENDHLAFGKGIHFCLGAPLARLEGKIAFGTLLRRCPNMRLAVEPEQLVFKHNSMRSLESLPVVF
ncbi:cytochrome P450 [Paenibacillus sp. SC116]|uniref:cytochrome P450 family protein n=1 Tax=Paenibacillus sp. SC116 TaxID=2968986 RepID=UPI00215A3585|nr:cytochrome P450 [Paenibacillus sp. SC116]MCR8842365.1 cytochrome P450 [Paenibacillus sp. SC116]